MIAAILCIVVGGALTIAPSIALPRHPAFAISAFSLGCALLLTGIVLALIYGPGQ